MRLFRRNLVFFREPAGVVVEVTTTINKHNLGSRIAVNKINGLHPVRVAVP